MESVYDRFHAYDFEKDKIFQDGLKSIQGNEGCMDMLKFKVFYYNRFVEVLDLESYKQWADRETHNLENTHRGGELKKMSIYVLSQCDSDSSSQRKGDDSLSFAEVYRLIQAGEDVPGIQKLDVTPCQQAPTESQMTRLLKPWEKDDAPSK